MLVSVGAGLLIVVGSDALLLAAFESPAVSTLALFVTVPADTVLTVSVMTLTPAGASGPGFVQVTTWPAAPQVQPVPVPETNARPVGSVSVTVIVAVVAAVPPFVTVKV